MSTNKRYSEDFKKTIVDLYNAGHSVKEINSEYGISDVATYKWIKNFSPMDSSNDEITSLDDL
ncbi:transposase [Tepidibacter mesophilus]|uniref:transposase n=1 Tax=Tepidibacter mesophilus TaxID=655607 RepID=UPI001FA8E5FC|nr:transposase [Tepidibacter mesophilus]